MTGIEAGKAYVKFLLDDKQLKQGLTKVGAKLQSVGKIGTAATAPIIAGFAACTKAFVDAGSQLDDLAQRSGISGKSLSGLSYAAGQTGTEIETLASGVARMQKNVAGAINGTGTFNKTLQEMGVDLTELRGMNPEGQFLRIADAISKVEDPTMRAALAQKTFGGAGRELIPLLNLGAAGINSLTAEAERLGITLDNQTIAAADELGDSLDVAKLQVHAMAVQIGAAVAGPLTDFLQTMQPIVATVVEFIHHNPDLVRSIAAITAVMGAASIASYGLGTAFTFLSRHPVMRFVILLTTAMVALNEAVKNASDWLSGDDAWAEQKRAEFAAIEKQLEDARQKLGVKSPAPTAPGIDAAGDIASEAMRLQSQADASLANHMASMAAPLNDQAEARMSREIQQVNSSMEQGVWQMVDILTRIERKGRGLTVGGF